MVFGLENLNPKDSFQVRLGKENQPRSGFIFEILGLKAPSVLPWKSGGGPACKYSPGEIKGAIRGVLVSQDASVPAHPGGNQGRQASSWRCWWRPGGFPAVCPFLCGVTGQKEMLWMHKRHSGKLLHGKRCGPRALGAHPGRANGCQEERITYTGVKTQSWVVFGFPFFPPCFASVRI